MHYHRPVLLSQSLKILNPQPGQIFVDATLGNGGHTLAILKHGAHVYAIDQDPKNLEISQNRIDKLGLQSNFHPIHGNFNQLCHLLPPGLKTNGLIADLGLSTNQIKATSRGFSFADPDSLDMRLDPKQQTVTAENIINTASYDDLFYIFSKFGQERFSKPLALKIIQQRRRQPIKTATRLAQIIKDYYQQKHVSSRLHPATKIFLALRIVVNNEFNNLKSLLDQSLSCLSPHTTVCIISFHSGEDRLVKQFIQSHRQITKITSKPITPTAAQIKRNPLCRSALLRAFQT